MNTESEGHSLLRGEHLTNLLEYLNRTRLKWDETRGYSLVFAQQHDQVLKDIVENPHKRVTIVTGFDDICDCGVSPNRSEKCQSQELREKDKSIACKHGIVVGKEYFSQGLIESLVKPRDRER